VIKQVEEVKRLKTDRRLVMTDVLLRATVPGVKAFAASTTCLVDEARRRHNCYPIATAALGRVMTSALLMAANLKNKESLTIRVSGNGPIGEIVADADNEGIVRGYVHNPQIHLPAKNGKLDVGGAVGGGHIYVTRFTGLKEPFTGSTELVSGEIAEDIAHYLLLSEQTPATIMLGVKVQPDSTANAAGGLLVQAMPGAEDDVLAKVESNLEQLPSITEMMEAGLDARGMIAAAFSDLPVTYGEPEPLAFRCRCSQERVERMLLSLGRQELESLVLEKRAEIKCHFCSQLYEFNQSELENILQELPTNEKASQ